MGRMLLVRHAESEGNREGRFTATPAVPLTPLGHTQAAQVVELLRTVAVPERVVSSPYRRAIQTAEIIARALGLEVDVEDDLRERSYGEFAGLPYATPRPDYDPQRYWAWRPPGGEDLVEVAARTGAALDRVRTRVPDGDVVVVSHGAVMMSLWRHVTGAWGAHRVMPNVGVVVATHDRERWLGAQAIDPGDPKWAERLRKELGSG